MVKLLVLGRERTARRVLRSLRLLGDSRLEYPHLRPSEFFVPGTYPANPRPAIPKLYAFVLHPGLAWYRASPYNRPEDVALVAANLLAGRHNAWLDWAAGYRASGAVWLLVKPYAYDRATGKRVWFRPTPGDLGALRELCPVQRERPAAGQRVRERTPERRTRERR